MEKHLKKYFALFALPTVLAFLTAFVVPFICGILLSFCKFTTVLDAKWVGIRNYMRAFSDKDFLNALGFTTAFAVVAVITINLIAFLMALLLTRGKKGTNTVRTIVFMPNLIGGIVLGYIWQLILNGILNTFGSTLTENAVYGFWGLVILMNWQLIGYMMVIYIAGVQNVPSELLDAAKVDGASPLQVVRYITMPLIRPAITICLFLTLTHAYKLFDQNLALTAGAPAKKTAMLALDIYNTFYGRNGWEGVGQAKAVLFSIIVAVIALTQLYLTRRKEIDN
ncbi:MAG TPA: sugar ABC transporter permease [Caproicibacter sp.]|nr:sugar ABC transporter permease [Caproicibacter sp.]